MDIFRDTMSPAQILPQAFHLRMIIYEIFANFSQHPLYLVELINGDLEILLVEDFENVHSEGKAWLLDLLF